MEEQKILNAPIGTEEPESLGAVPVICHGVKLEERKKKDGKVVGSQVVFIMKHPDRQDYLNISKVKVQKGNNLRVFGTWINLDKKEEIQKGSALAGLMSYYALTKLGESTGKTFETTEDDDGYLCIKAY